MPEDAQIVLTPGVLPEGFCPMSEQERYSGYTAATTALLPGNFSSFNMGSSQPTVDNQGLPWIKQNADGSLIGIYTFANGAWARPHEIPPGSNGFRALWVGTTLELETYDGGAAGAVTDYSGPFWAVDSDFTDKIPVGAGTNAAVGVNANQLSSGASATDQVRGVYFIMRTARIYRTS